MPSAAQKAAKKRKRHAASSPADNDVRLSRDIVPHANVVPQVVGQQVAGPHSVHVQVVVEAMESWKKGSLCPVAQFAVEGTPRANINALSAAIGRGFDVKLWHSIVVVTTMVSSVQGSVAAIQSGLRCWGAFCDDVLGLSGHHLPPAPRDLVAWSATFRSSGTLRNYLRAVRFGCEFVNVPSIALDHISVKRAKSAVSKRETWQNAAFHPEVRRPLSRAGR